MAPVQTQMSLNIEEGSKKEGQMDGTGEILSSFVTLKMEEGL